MPEFGRHPPDVEPTYQGPRIGPNTQAILDANRQHSKRDTLTVISLQEMEMRLEKRIVHLCLIAGAIGAVGGFCIYVLVGLII